jgi:pantoate--beta-alanine ligase
MAEFAAVEPLRGWVARQRQAGRRIGLVPTMGALHEGHLTLVDTAARLTDAVVVSIFVNPLQFGPHEDLSRYPRDLVRDRALLAGRGAQALFVPEVGVMYPTGSEIRVVPGELAARWEGAVRPDHFTGVLTIVAKLFNLVQPDLAVFGQKDIQQAILIRQLVRDLDFPVVLEVVPIVREADGMALSSRNAYLSSEDRRDGLILSKALRTADAAWRAGEQNSTRLAQLLEQQFLAAPAVTLDYVAIVDSESLEPVAQASAGTIVALAARVGPTRLLDNHILGAEFR